MGIELMTSSLPRMRSTPELHRLTVCLGAENEVRTRDPQLGRLMLYQLSYFRKILRRDLRRLWEVVDSNHRTLRERIYSPPQLPLCEPPIGFSIFQSSFEPIEGFEPTTPRLQISGQLSYIGAHESFIAERTAKVDTFFESSKNFQRFFIISRIRSYKEASSMPQEALWAF